MCGIRMVEMALAEEHSHDQHKEMMEPRYFEPLPTVVNGVDAFADRKEIKIDIHFTRVVALDVYDVDRGSIVDTIY
jgi:hypothetical protein